MILIYSSSAVCGAQHHDFDAGFNSRVATVFFYLFFTSDDFFTVRRFLTFTGRRFALKACGGITFLHLMRGSRVPYGVTSGWDRESQAGACFVFPPCMESIPRNIFISNMENSTGPFSPRSVQFVCLSVGS